MLGIGPGLVMPVGGWVSGGDNFHLGRGRIIRSNYFPHLFAKNPSIELEEIKEVSHTKKIEINSNKTIENGRDICKVLISSNGEEGCSMTLVMNTFLLQCATAEWIVTNSLPFNIDHEKVIKK
ncbi:hypothetical protein RCL_jg17848.t1 [Rhizophagus clarus]|uniref:Uncharacterized protein n=1 Tax=Rhizophagus clarus TaxID=94130 RepID=A0A8H3QJ39_9GLOM|nr:hypothetical protein RCL_jg17848.t1 [Rhizophagus clarus]